VGHTSAFEIDQTYKKTLTVAEKMISHL
jgi:hypothetical protein